MWTCEENGVKNWCILLKKVGEFVFVCYVTYKFANLDTTGNSFSKDFDFFFGWTVIVY